MSILDGMWLPNFHVFFGCGQGSYRESHLPRPIGKKCHLEMIGYRQDRWEQFFMLKSPSASGFPQATKLDVLVDTEPVGSWKLCSTKIVVNRSFINPRVASIIHFPGFSIYLCYLNMCLSAQHE